MSDEESEFEVETEDGGQWKCHVAIYFSVYIVSFLFIGILYALPSALLDTLMHQIGSDEQTMATIFTPCAIAALLFTILSSIIVDKIKHFHIILSFLCLTTSIAISLVYFATHYYQILIVYVMIYVCSNTLIPVIIVAIFRVFNVESSWITSMCITLAFVMCTITPQIIQYFSDNDRDYRKAMYLCSAFGIITTVFLVCVPSPNRSRLIQDVEKITQDIAKSGDGSNNIDVDQYFAHSKRLILPTVNRHYSINIHLQMSPGVINEVRAVTNQCNPRSEREVQVLDNLFFDHEDAINPYQVIAMTDAEDDGKTDEEDASVSSSDQCTPATPGFWFDFEKKDTLPPGTIKQTNVTYSFAIIAILGDFLKSYNRYAYLAFIITFVRNVHGLSSAHGLNLISTYFFGVMFGQFITTFLLKRFKSQNICLFFSILMIVGAVCFVIAIYIDGENVLITLHAVSVLNGFGSAPLYSASLATLCSIQPLTGILSSMYNSADVLAGFAVSISGVLITQFGIEIGLNYVHFVISLFICVLFVVNKIKYDDFIGKNH